MISHVVNEKIEKLHDDAELQLAGEVRPDEVKGSNLGGARRSFILV